MAINPHVLVIPCPRQGHFIPLLEFSQCLANHGFRITFVSSESIHNQVLKSLEGKDSTGEQIHLVSIPDGLGDRNGNGNMIERILQVMPGKLEELIEEINGRESEKIACLVADGTMGWAVEVAERMKMKRAAVWTASAASLASTFSIPKLIDDGIINNNGTPIKKQMIQLAPNTPAMNTTTDFYWACVGDLTTQKNIFDLAVYNAKAMKMVDWLFCNSTYDLEQAAFTIVPKLLPTGPLLASNRLGNSVGYFGPEDSNCLKWLDQRHTNTVIYVAFGSSTIFNKIQFREIALGLELCNRPFLWVVRSDITIDGDDAFLEGFKERVADRGRLVSWAPQQAVLSHPSVACFLSHCGWNSTMEGVSNGVPFLCLPYFAEQFLNEGYICNVWKVGLKFNKNVNGIITKEEIKNKVDQMLSDENVKARALELKEKVLGSVREGGFSSKTFQNFSEWIKA